MARLAAYAAASMVIDPPQGQARRAAPERGSAGGHREWARSSATG